MAFNAYNALEIASGQPVKAELWDKAKDNFDDHESRILDLEATGLTSPPIIFAIIGEQAYIGAATGLCYLRIPFNLTLTSAKLYVPITGSSGTIEVDVQKKTGGGAFASIFSTRPSVAQATGSYATSSNAVLGTTALVTADNLRLDTVSVMTGLVEAYLYLTYTVG